MQQIIASIQKCVSKNCLIGHFWLWLNVGKSPGCGSVAIHLNPLYVEKPSLTMKLSTSSAQSRWLHWTGHRRALQKWSSGVHKSQLNGWTSSGWWRHRWWSIVWDRWRWWRSMVPVDQMNEKQASKESKASQVDDIGPVIALIKGVDDTQRTAESPWSWRDQEETMWLVDKEWNIWFWAMMAIEQNLKTKKIEMSTWMNCHRWWDDAGGHQIELLLRWQRRGVMMMLDCWCWEDTGAFNFMKIGVVLWQRLSDWLLTTAQLTGTTLHWIQRSVGMMLVDRMICCRVDNDWCWEDTGALNLKKCRDDAHEHQCDIVVKWTMTGVERTLMHWTLWSSKVLKEWCIWSCRDSNMKIDASSIDELKGWECDLTDAKEALKRQGAWRLEAAPRRFECTCGGARDATMDGLSVPFDCWDSINGKGVHWKITWI